jgi:aryl-alcohol dehydrogenase-like predicted oxidoreductase
MCLVLQPRHIMSAVKASLKRLGTDYVDLYQIHGLDPVAPIEETIRALDDLVRQGHVRYIGVSNWPAWTIMKALGIAEKRGWTRLSTLQAYYTIAGRDIEREIAPLLKAERLGLMVWSPLAGGIIVAARVRKAPVERRSTFRQSTSTGHSIASTSCARSATTAAYPWRASRSPGSSTGRWSCR